MAIRDVSPAFFGPLLAAMGAAFALAVAGGEPAPVVPVPDPAPSGGGILRMLWTGIGGTAVSDLSALDDFPDYPASTSILPSFEAPVDIGDNYGTKMCGYLVPPTTGEYLFWIASDDGSELWLSANENPAERKKIAGVNAWTAPRSWEQYPEQKSAPVRLTAGKRYYVEALHKEGGGGDHVAVGWQLPDGTQERPIPGTRLAPFQPPKLAPRIPKPPPSSPGDYRLKFEAQVNQETLPMHYVLSLPQGYSPAGERWPLLIFLHGAGEGGPNLDALYYHGPNAYLRNDPKAKEHFPFAVLSPQCPAGRRWDSPGQITAVVQLLDYALKNFRLGPECVYATGLSRGGKGRWMLAFEAPERLAAIAPICAIAMDPEKALARLGGLSVWIIVGGADGGYTEGSHKMFEALSASKREVRFTEIPNEGHGVWSKYYPMPEFYQWFAKQTRTSAPKTAPPRETASAPPVHLEPQTGVVPALAPKIAEKTEGKTVQPAAVVRSGPVGEDALPYRAALIGAGVLLCAALRLVLRPAAKPAGVALRRPVRPVLVRSKRN